MQSDLTADQNSSRLLDISALFSKALNAFSRRPFQPHRLFRGGHAQTLAAFAWPRQHRFKSVQDEERLFEVTADVKVMGHCRWQADRVRPSNVGYLAWD